MKEHYLYQRNDVDFSHTVEQYVKSLEKRISEGDWGITGIPTEFRDLDCLIGGLKEGELTLLAGLGRGWEKLLLFFQLATT